MLSLAILGLLPRSARVTGSVRLEGEELLTATPKEWNFVRGGRAAMVFQDPMTALNPMYSVGWQVAECVRLHSGISRGHARKRAVELLELVGLPQPQQLARRYPHELSGGMRQRVVIAIAIANEPELLIADEPTTALDVTVQAQILDTLRSIRTETGSAMILISHDLGVVAGVADRLLVMYAGKAVETGDVDDVFRAPRMPYTIGLLASLPSIDERRGRLASIAGTPPSGTGYGKGCAFAPRCPIAAPQCADEPPVVTVGPAHTAACVFAAASDSPDDGAVHGLALLAWDHGDPSSGEPATEHGAWDEEHTNDVVIDRHGPEEALSDPGREVPVGRHARSGQWRQPRASRRAMPRRRRRIRLRENHPRPPTAAPRGTHGGHHHDERSRHHDPRRQGHAGSPPSNPNGVPGPVLLAQPTSVRRRDRRRAADRAPDTQSGRARAVAAFECRPRPSGSRPLPGEFSGGQRQRIGIARRSPSSRRRSSSTSQCPPSM